jgi:hypothetical protein
MQTKTFRGKDEIDVKQQLWAWRNANPNVVVTREHPVEALPLDMRPVGGYAKLEAADQVTMRVDFEQS